MRVTGIRVANWLVWLPVIAVVVALLAMPGVAAAQQLKVGIDNYGQANFFQRTGRAALIDEVTVMGGIPIATVSDNVPARMVALENFIAQGVDIIIIQEGDVKMVEPALLEAKRQGIIVVSMDAGTADFVDIVVESNNWVLGTMAATTLVNKLGGEARVVEIYNDLGQQIRMRRKMLHAVLSEYPNSEIVAGFVYSWPDFFPDIKGKMEAVLAANPEPGAVNAVFATFDGAGVAASAAIREAGLQDHIIVVGIDGDPETYEEMLRPDSPFYATMAQDPDGIARLAVQKAYALHAGDETARDHFYVPGILVTRDDARAGRTPLSEGQ